MVAPNSSVNEIDFCMFQWIFCLKTLNLYKYSLWSFHAAKLQTSARVCSTLNLHFFQLLTKRTELFHVEQRKPWSFVILFVNKKFMPENCEQKTAKIAPCQWIIRGEWCKSLKITWTYFLFVEISHWAAHSPIIWIDASYTTDPKCDAFPCRWVNNLRRCWWHTKMWYERHQVSRHTSRALTSSHITHRWNCLCVGINLHTFFRA